MNTATTTASTSTPVRYYRFKPLNIGRIFIWSFFALLLIGCMQTFAVSLDWSLGGISIAQAAPMLPYLLMVLLLIFRPKGLMGTREG